MKGEPLEQAVTPKKSKPLALAVFLYTPAVKRRAVGSIRANRYANRASRQGRAVGTYRRRSKASRRGYGKTPAVIQRGLIRAVSRLCQHRTRCRPEPDRPRHALRNRRSLASGSRLYSKPTSALSVTRPLDATRTYRADSVGDRARVGEELRADTAESVFNSESLSLFD